MDGVYRLGGDEFGVVLPDTGADDAAVVMARAIRLGAPPFSWGSPASPRSACPMPTRCWRQPTPPCTPSDVVADPPSGPCGTRVDRADSGARQRGRNDRLAAGGRASVVASARPSTRAPAGLSTCGRTDSPARRQRLEHEQLAGRRRRTPPPPGVRPRAVRRRRPTWRRGRAPRGGRAAPHKAAPTRAPARVGLPRPTVPSPPHRRRAGGRRRPAPPPRALPRGAPRRACSSGRSGPRPHRARPLRRPRPHRRTATAPCTIATEGGAPPLPAATR